MNERNTLVRPVKESDREIDLKELFLHVISYWYIIVAAMVIIGLIVGIYFIAFVPNEYTAQATLYVRNQANEQYISSSDLTGSAMLTQDYKELIKSRTVVSKTCELLGINSLEGYAVTVASVSNTRFIKISVTGSNPESVTRIANTMAQVFSETVLSIMEVDNVSIVDTAVVPKSPSGPARLRNIAIASAAAGILTIIVLVMIDLFSNSIKTVEDIEEQLGIQVLAQVATVKNVKKKALGR